MKFEQSLPIGSLNWFTNLNRKHIVYEDKRSRSHKIINFHLIDLKFQQDLHIASQACFTKTQDDRFRLFDSSTVSMATISPHYNQMGIFVILLLPDFSNF